jgi:hypothetical protein
MRRTIKRTKTRSCKSKTRRHRGGFGQEPVAQPEPPAQPAQPAPSLFQAPTEPVKPCGWWGSIFGCPKTTGGRRKKRNHKKSVSFQR